MSAGGAAPAVIQAPSGESSMRHATRIRTFALALAVIAAAQSSPAQPESPSPAAAQPTAEPAAAELDLGQRQQQIQRDYERFEQKLFELSEVTRASDPERAELLNRTRSQSRELRVLDQMRAIARLLSDGNELGDAVSRQEEVLVHLEALLKLLQSEDARDRIAQEIARLEDLLKDTNRVIGEQKDARAATERGGDTQGLQSRQQRVTDHAQQLADKIDRQDAERAAEQPDAPRTSSDQPQPADDAEQPPREKPEGDTNPPQQEPSEASPSQPAPSSDKPSSQDGSRSQPSPSSPDEPPPQGGSPQPPQPGAPSQPPGQQPQKPQPSKQGASPQQPQPTPGREELEQALQEMNRAIEELKQQNREGASNEQDAALAHLERMKAQLEEILRQLREEEREMFLTMLEARFQEMLRLQLRINAETERLDKVAADERTSRHAAKTTELGRSQRDNALEADRALVLLKEEGSSVAFPEAVQQMRDNMLSVAGRLDRTDTGQTTQLIEQIIVETLDEMILALQRELEKLKEQEQQQQQQQQQDRDPALVDVLAELKMIRSLQNQVNRLTRQIGLDVEGEQAHAPETRQLLQDLARRQQRIQEATYDLSTGKASLGQQLRQGPE